MKKYGIFPKSKEDIAKVFELSDMFGDMRQAFKELFGRSKDRQATAPLFYEHLSQMVEVLEI